jgi:hypothetical protein
MVIGLAVVVAFVTFYITTISSSAAPSDLRQLSKTLESLISDSCTDCQPTELNWDIGSKGLTVAFDRKSGPCPTIVTGQRFYSLGVKRSILATIGGKELSMPKSSVFQSCHVDWQVQLAN